MTKIKNTNRKASSLLVTIMIMGILMTLALGLSSLILKEIRQTSDVVFAGKAYYAAEAGIENALLDLHQSLPGYETAKDADQKYTWMPNVKFDNSTEYTYQIRNQGDKYPYFDPDKPYFVTADMAVPPSELYNKGTIYAAQTYNVLPLNQTVTIPLFTDCGKNGVNNVKDFLLQYYVDFHLDPKYGGETLDPGYKASMNSHLQDFDILRWKLFGAPDNDPGKTEAISDFYPAHQDNSAINPVCIGTSIDLAKTMKSDCLIPLKSPLLKTNNDYIDSIDDLTNANVAGNWSFARECYASDSGMVGAPVNGDIGIMNRCDIKGFMNIHKRNYLTLTNIVNPDIIGISNLELRKSRANIYYRIIASGGDNAGCSSGSNPLPREYASISADGFAGNVTQSIDVQMKLNSFLPVFNFSLYRTDVTKDLQLNLIPGLKLQTNNFPSLPGM